MNILQQLSGKEKIPPMMEVAAREMRRIRAEVQDQLLLKTKGLIRPPIPPAFDFLYATHTDAGVPVRYKVAKGGRGKGATWSIGRRLIDKAQSRRSIILCTREVQNSIADSVHRLLRSQIHELGYGDFFYITDHRIRNLITDSEFIFRGLNDLTVEGIKSMEGVTDVWCAEAEQMGKRSWEVLDPTIRTAGSEIYIDYNPKRTDSPTNVMFTTNCPDNAIVKHINYDQNPYFPLELEKLRQQAYDRIERAINDDARIQAQHDYNHVWLGACQEVNEASIFGAHFIVENFDPLKDEGEWDGPYDGADWGFSQDPTVRIRLWIHTKMNGRRRLCIEREAYGHGVELLDLPAMFDVFPDSRKVRIRGDNARPETISYMKNAGFNIVAADKWKGSVEDGIEHMKGAYDVIVCHSRCVYTEKELINYSFKVDRLTGDITTDIIDANNHCMDACRYAVEPLVQRKKGAHLFSKHSGVPK